MQPFKDQKKYQMNSNLEIAVILLDITNYFFVFLLVFNLFKVNYFNPIVTIFLKIYKPISKVLGIFPNQIINIFIIAIVLKVSSLVISADGKYEILVLIGAARGKSINDVNKQYIISLKWKTYNCSISRYNIRSLLFISY